MYPIKALIIDDEPLACKRIQKLLSKNDSIAICDICYDGVQALDSIAEHDPDVLFLDIEMPNLTGVELIKGLPEKDRPLIVFVTAYNSYAIEAFNFFALDYLLKPFTEERFNRTVARIIEIVKQNNKAKFEAQLEAFLAFASTTTPAVPTGKKKMAIPLGNRMYFLQIDEIQYIEASSNYVNIYTNKTKHVLRETLGSIQKKLAPNGFIRIHKSYVINQHYLKEIKKTPAGDWIVHMNDGASFSVGKTYKKDFLEQIM